MLDPSSSGEAVREVWWGSQSPRRSSTPVRRQYGAWRAALIFMILLKDKSANDYSMAENGKRPANGSPDRGVTLRGVEAATGQLAEALDVVIDSGYRE
jgi:hypothetical protein